MSRRTNFLDGNDNFREQNLRFVRNEFEDNMNQFFGGGQSAPANSQQQRQPPARDSLIVQPTPGGRRGTIGTGNPEVDQRRQFLRQVGLGRNRARSLVKRSLKVPNFNLRDFQRKRFQLTVELGDNRQKEVDDIVIREFIEFIEANEPVNDRPRTPSPPRNINWNETENSPPPPPRLRNASLEDRFGVQAFQRNIDQDRFSRDHSPDVDQHGNRRWQQQHQNFNQSSSRQMVEQNEGENFRHQTDVDRHANYRPQDRFNSNNDRSRQTEDDCYNPRMGDRSPDIRNTNFDNSDFNPNSREWDGNQDFRGDYERNFVERNPEFRNQEYEPEFHGRQLSPSPRNHNRGPDLHANKEPNYERFVQIDDNNEDRVFLIRNSDFDSDHNDNDHLRSNQRNFMDGCFEDSRYNNQNQQRFSNNDAEFQRPDNFRQNFGGGDKNDHRPNFISNERPMEFSQGRNESNYNNNYNNREENVNISSNFGNRDLQKLGNNRVHNQEKGGWRAYSDSNDMQRNQFIQNISHRPQNDRFNEEGRGGPPRQLPNEQNLDGNNLHRNQSFPEQWERRGPMPSSANQYQSNRTDIDFQSMRNQSRDNNRGGPQRTERMNRPNPVTATITNQQTSGRRQLQPNARNVNQNTSFAGALTRSQPQGNRSRNERPPIAGLARNQTQVAENNANTPRTGFCVKSFKVNSNEKFFINVCQAAEVPAPPADLTEEELIAILESPDPGSFRVPMSISELRTTKDRSNKTVDVCDIAINPKFLVKINKSQLFNNFFLQIVTEALSEKYNIQISMEKTITLNNRKFIGTLVPHRVRNDDVKVVNQLSSSSEEQKLVQEIDATNAAKTTKVESIAPINSKEPQYKLRARVRDDVVDEIYAELYLPSCVSSQELSLDIGEDRILVESLRHDYIFDKFLNYRLQQERAQALFDKTSKMLQIRIPVHSV